MRSNKLTRQLRNTLVAYCRYMEAKSLDEFAHVIQQGGLPWFPDAFAQAMTDGIFTPDTWDRITETDLEEDDFDQVETDLRVVWAHTAPDRPFPLGQ